jgi:hypothetical protein
VAIPNRIACPLCQASIKTPALPPGAVCNCPKCGGQFRVPGKEATGAASSVEGDFFELPKPPSSPATASPALTRKREEPQESYPALISPEADELPADDMAVVCRLCSSRYYAPRGKLGQEVPCPDCHTKNIVTPPPPKSKKAAVVLTGDDYALLDEPVVANPARGPIPAPVGDRHAPAPALTEPPLPRGEGVANKELAAAMLAKAAAELEEQTPDRPDMTDELRPFFHGTITSLAQAPGIALLAVSSVGLTLLVYDLRLIRGGLGSELSTETFKLHFFTIFAMAAGLAGLPLVLGPLAAACQAIVQDTAAGQKRVESWPSISFFEWIGDALVVLAAAFVAAVPALLLMSPGLLFLKYPGLIVPGAVLVSLWALFPIVFLSMADAGSIVAIASPKILGSLGRSGERWFLFYFVSILLTFGAYFAVAVMLEAQTPIVVPVCCVALIASLFVYSRWLGRLAFFIAKDEADAEEKAERAQRYTQRVA